MRFWIFYGVPLLFSPDYTKYNNIQWVLSPPFCAINSTKTTIRRIGIDYKWLLFFFFFFCSWDYYGWCSQWKPDSRLNWGWSKPFPTALLPLHITSSFRNHFPPTQPPTRCRLTSPPAAAINCSSAQPWIWRTIEAPTAAFTPLFCLFCFDINALCRFIHINAYLLNTLYSLVICSYFFAYFLYNFCDVLLRVVLLFFTSPPLFLTYVIILSAFFTSNWFQM